MEKFESDDDFNRCSPVVLVDPELLTQGLYEVDGNRGNRDLPNSGYETF